LFSKDDPNMRIAIGVAYRGTEFDGWQTQPSGKAVQDVLERALSEIAGHRIALTAAGRTDARVHASAQVAHFDAAVERPETAWVRGANALLPETVSVQWAARVADDFHARYSAIVRAYRYVLYQHAVRPALLAGLVGWAHGELDVDAMRRAARLLVGEHDFSTFRSAECQAKSPVRVLERADIDSRAPYVLFDFSANAFLHHMVRNIVGCLVYVGKGKHPPEWIAELIEKRDRRLAAPTFPPEGLYLTEVRYDARWKLPAFPRMMAFDTHP
jgi:tRNA pseudouridine38-40 synthase